VSERGVSAAKKREEVSAPNLIIHSPPTALSPALSHPPGGVYGGRRAKAGGGGGLTMAPTPTAQLEPFTAAPSLSLSNLIILHSLHPFSLLPPLRPHFSSRRLGLGGHRPLDGGAGKRGKREKRERTSAPAPLSQAAAGEGETWRESAFPETAVLRRARPGGPRCGPAQAHADSVTALPRPARERAGIRGRPRAVPRATRAHSVNLFPAWGAVLGALLLPPLLWDARPARHGAGGCPRLYPRPPASTLLDPPLTPFSH